MQGCAEKQPQRWKGISAAFLSGQAVSILGSGLVQFAIIWFVTMRANSGTALMIITLTSFIPQLVIAPFAGVWADRHDRRWLIILSDSGIALVTLATAIFFLLGYDRVWMIYIAAAIRSLGGGIQSPAIKALIPQITPHKELVRINGLYSTLDNVVLLLSPVLGGALITLFPVWIVFMVDVETAAIAVSIMLGLPVPHQRTGIITTATGRRPRLKPGTTWGFPTPEELEIAAAGEDLEDVSLPHEPVTRQFRRGFAYVGTNPVIRNLMIIYALFMVLLSPIATLFPLFIRRHFDAQVWRVSAAQTAVFTGMAAGGLAVSLKGQFKSKLNTIRMSGLLVAAGTLGLACFGLVDSPLFVLFIALAFLLGIIVPFYTTAVTTFFQEQVERAYHGRVFSLLYMVGSAAIPLGAAIFGPLADLFPIAYLLLFTSAAQLLILIFSWKAVPKGFRE
ncbi:MAG TPA: MFS transporter [Bacillota bacterium]|nr:MFS transporter [Bacillota bacterium]HQB81116.1 MFS transporter [Bacillota bacterium]